MASKKDTKNEALRPSREHFQAVIDSAPFAIFIKDLRGRYVMANKMCADILEVPQHEILGKNDHQLFPADSAQKLAEEDKQVIENAVRLEYENALEIRGEVYDFQNVKIPIFNRQGRIVGVGGIANNITHLKSQQRQFDSSQNFLKLVLENIPDYVTVQDENARIIDANKAFIDTFSSEPNQDILDDKVFSHKPKAAKPITDNLTNKAGFNSFTDSHDLKLHTREINFTGPDDSHYLLSISSDITEQIQEEDTLEHIYRVAQNSDLSFNKKMTEVLKITNEYLGTKIAVITSIHDEKCTLEHSNSRRKAFKKGESYPLKDMLCFYTYSYQSIQAHKNIADSELADCKGHTQMGIKSYIGAPIFVDGQIFGTVSFADLKKRKNNFTSREKNVVKLLAQLISYEVAVSNVIEKLKARDKRYEFAALASRTVLWDWHIDTDEILWAGQSHLLMGYKRERDLPNNSVEFFDTILHPDDKELVKSSFAHHFKTKEPFDLEVRIKAGTGEYNWYQVRAEALWDRFGQAIRVSGSITNITAQKEMQTALRDSEEKFRIAYENSPMGFALVGLDGSFLDVNPALCEMLGYTRAELLETDFQRLTHPDDLGKGLNFMNSIEAGKPISFQLEKRYLHKDGHIIWAILKTSVIYSDEGEAEYLISQILDITARKEALENERQSHKMAALGQLAGGIAHELNNLLQPSLMSAEMIARKLPDNADPEINKYINLIINSALKSSEIIDDVLAFSRLDSGSRTRLPIAQSAKEACEFAQELLPKTVKINIIGFEKHKNEKALINNSDFTRIMTNLMINAYHAGGPKVKIDIDYQLISLTDKKADILNLKAGDYAKITITDNGSGIEPNVLDHVFDPFFTTKDNEGTGLGLPIVFGIIQNWHGMITIDSELGKGTCFNIYIPIDKTPRR